MPRQGRGDDTGRTMQATFKKRLHLTGTFVLVGNYGSGKTEIAVNLALYHQRRGVQVRVADLDLVNPYFRTREARGTLAAAGVELVLPPEEYLHADLPILSPLVAGLIRHPAELTIIDVGGNDVGATVLGSLKEAFETATVRLLQVVNPARPFSATVTACQDIRARIEAAARQPIDGLVSNANLMDETRVEDILRGYRFGLELARAGGLPLEWITVPSGLLELLEPSKIDCPILPIDRQLLFPWHAQRTPGTGSGLKK